MNSLDMKSLVIGFLFASLIIISIAASNDKNGNGRYTIIQATTSCVVLDTSTGEYRYLPFVSSEREWKSVR